MICQTRESPHHHSPIRLSRTLGNDPSFDFRPDRDPPLRQCPAFPRTAFSCACPFSLPFFGTDWFSRALLPNLRSALWFRPGGTYLFRSLVFGQGNTRSSLTWVGNLGLGQAGFSPVRSPQRIHSLCQFAMGTCESREVRSEKGGSLVVEPTCSPGKGRGDRIQRWERLKRGIGKESAIPRRWKSLESIDLRRGSWRKGMEQASNPALWRGG